VVTEVDTRATQKNGAYHFLEELKQHLCERLPPPQKIAQEVRRIVASAKANDNPKHLKSPEAVLTNHFLIPAIFEFVSRRIGKVDAQLSMLSEYREMRKEFCGQASPQRQERHPFSKDIADGPHAIMRRWKGEANKQTIQSAPDLALRNPFPFNVVFEIKYFESGGPENAETELVTDLYQAFFYRGLPYVPATKNKPSWDYDYACLIAADASQNGTLLQSWKGLPSKVKDGFWDGANVYAMILRREVA
jgi:hypothetical protein